MLLPLAVLTADNEQIFTDLPFRLGKKASLSLANVAWYVLHVQAEHHHTMQIRIVLALYFPSK